MYNSKLCIVVPYHKNKLSNSEESSLIQLGKIFCNKYEIVLVLPLKEKDKFIENHIKLIKLFSISIKPLYNNEFSTYQKYNTFLCRKEFYTMFKNYEFILLYQLDAWVIKDNIEMFMDLNLDYIGAPIFKHEFNKMPSIILGGGNGGVSLRKVSSAIHITNYINKYFSAKLYFNKIGYQYNFSHKPWKFVVKKFLSSLIYFNTNGKLWPFPIQEDVFWSVIVPQIYPQFSTSDLKTSSKFAFDLYPSFVYKFNYELPAFIHAWEKNNDGLFQNLVLNEKNELLFKIKNDV